jgi:dihydroorotase
VTAPELDPTAALATPDLVLAGGRVIDPSRGIDTITDVAVAGRTIVAMGPGLASRAAPGTEIVDVAGLLVTPGLIDLHVHIYPGLGNFCVLPDQAGVERGVPIVVDGGTSGTATINLARQWLDASAPRTEVLGFLDPNVLYLATHDFICHKLEIANDLRNLDMAAAVEALEAHADFLVGFKVRACHVGDPTVSPFLEAAKEMAGDRPIMVHLGRFPHTPTIDTTSLLGALRGGDIITHAFRGASGVMDLDTRLPSAAFRDAIDRGVQLDIGHSATDFRFRDARRLLDAGIRPDTISTDLNIFNIDHPVGSLAETMSKIWALGVELDDVIAMTTINTAKAIHREHEYGTLHPGR